MRRRTSRCTQRLPFLLAACSVASTHALLLPVITPVSRASRRAAKEGAWRKESPWKSPYQETPAINGGDIWIGARGDDDYLDLVADEATASKVSSPAIPQFYPRRPWLWSQWNGTILKRVLPREVLLTLVFAMSIAWLQPALQPVAAAHAVSASAGAAGAAIASALASIEKVWILASSLVSFTLSFFLRESYDFWRQVYKLCRTVQGRLNDISMLAASAAERDASGNYTDDARQLLDLLSRYVRLFSILMYASCTSRFAILRTPRGLSELVKRGALTSAEQNALLQSSSGHVAVLQWINTLLSSGLADGRLCGSRTGGDPHALQLSLHAKQTELRAAYASISDQLTGRMPLAYTQLVQIMADLLIGFTPLALLHSVGGVGAIFGSTLVTLFHSSILNLAKMFLDPLNNDQYSGNCGINVATMMQETNRGSVRWIKAALWVPDEVQPLDRRQSAAATPPGVAYTRANGPPAAVERGAPPTSPREGESSREGVSLTPAAVPAVQLSTTTMLMNSATNGNA